MPNKSADQIEHAGGFALEKTGDAALLSRGAGVAEKALTAIKGESTVFRVFGGDTKPDGFSWTKVDPQKVGNFRDAAGLPSGGASGSINMGQFTLRGTVKKADIMQTRSALPLDGNRGGLHEVIIKPINVEVMKVIFNKPAY